MEPFLFLECYRSFDLLNECPASFSVSFSLLMLWLATAVFRDRFVECETVLPIVIIYVVRFMCYVSLWSILVYHHHDRHCNRHDDNDQIFIISCISVNVIIIATQMHMSSPETNEYF